jgi:hypothetical protein
MRELDLPRVLPGEPGGDIAEEAGGERRRWRTVAARAMTVLAGLVVLLVLVAPVGAGRRTVAEFLRLPVEGLFGIALLLALPARARRVVALLIGVALGLLAITKIVDVGFLAVLDRPFDPVLDWTFLDAGTVFLTRSVGRVAAAGVVAAAVGLAAALLLVVVLSTLRLAPLVTRHRTRAARIVAALGVVWLACAVLGVQIVPNVPVAAHGYYDRLVQARASLHDRDAFGAAAAVDAFRDVPGEDLLTALRGKDVVVALVESYGRVALEDPALAPQVSALLDDGTHRLRAAGFTSRSAFLTSPTAGGGSWLAQATILSGLWINNQQRYDSLVRSDRLTLSGAFRRAGWRTVGVMPGVILDWPEGGFFGYDRIYAAKDLGYRGPDYSFATMPDQYTLSAFERLERTTTDRTPVMAVIPLISSHAPWSPVPDLIDWDDVGDGSGYHATAGAGDAADVVLHRDPSRVRADYLRAIEYSLDTIISYVERYGDDDLVVVFLGDHQPAPVVAGEGASRDAPITIVAGDPAVLDRVSGWGWREGLDPGAQAPVWGMDEFRDGFLTAFGP